LVAAIDGWKEANGTAKPDHMTRDELHKLMERYPDAH
jgi:hypothetical protein